MLLTELQTTVEVSVTELADLHVELNHYKMMNKELASFIHREMHRGIPEDSCNFRICQINRIFRGIHAAPNTKRV